jgi:hypothetical protein
MARSNAVAGSAGYLLSHDVDGNGRIDFADFDAIFKQDQSVLPGYTPRIAGDANGDGIFDSSDLVQVMQRNLYRSGKFASFADGDWNRDGLFDESDFVFAFQQGTYQANSPVAARLATDVAFAEDSFVVDDRLNVRGFESVN